MDTHITDADLGPAGLGLASPIGLPGEAASSGEPFAARERLGATSSPEATDSREASITEPTVQARRARRGALLAGVAAVVLLGACGADLYAFRDDIHSGDLAHRLTAMVSRSANTSQSAPMEAGVTAYPVVAVPSKPLHPSDAAQITPTPAARADSAATLARELAALQSFGKPGKRAPIPLEVGGAPTPLPQPTGYPVDGIKPALVVAPPPHNSTAPQTSAASQQEAGVALPELPSQSGKATPAALNTTPGLLPASPDAPDVAAAPVTQAPPAASAPPPVTTPREPATVAAELKAGPMTNAQQVEVVGLVKSLGAQLRDTRIEVAQLHQVVAQLSEKLETRTADFENRLGLAEAGAILQSSARAGFGPLASDGAAPSLPSSSTTQAVHLASARSAVPLPAAPPPLPERRTVKDYVVKGASPGLAVLAALNPVAGSGNAIEVGVGDPVPGLGRVKKVYQRGTTWIVETENGLIQQ